MASSTVSLLFQMWMSLYGSELMIGWRSTSPLVTMIA
jgi:hypothetical protein